MKLKNILLTGLVIITSTSCSDFLKVDAPSAYPDEFVYSQKSEMNRALNGIYASILKNELYGNAYQRTFILNSDVDMQVNSNNVDIHNGYAFFNCTSQGGEIASFWNSAYATIEYVNRFLHGMVNSEIYDENDAEMLQMIGEAKCLRAMVYHDLVVMFGDVPFTFTAAAQFGEEYGNEDYVIPVSNREDIQKQLIEDLKGIAPKMQSSATTTVEHASKEFAWSLIARIALTAGGYSLHPEEGNAAGYGVMKRPQNYQEYYQIAQTYADSVINQSRHTLTLSYQEVFTQESNFQVVSNDDPIFEIPFAKESTGNTGYIQGPTSTAYEGRTTGKNGWGASSGNGRLNAFYRYSFDENDKRRDFVNGLWYYGSTTGTVITQDSCLVRADYTVHNNKWSKLWANTGQFSDISVGSTGINYPYMRLADVLLMHAEATNELNGPTAEAQESLRKVRVRAFDDQSAVSAYVAQAASSKETFLKAVLDERKWEFAGENMRWRDLVRNNLYSRELVYSFLRYLTVAMNNTGSYSGFEDDIIAYDGSDYIETLPEEMHYHVLPQDTSTWRVAPSSVYGHPYPNKTLDMLYIYNPYKATARPALISAAIEVSAWQTATFYQWGQNSVLSNQCRYSFNGYILYSESGAIEFPNKTSGSTQLNGSVVPEVNALPVVRYILPYPNAAIQRSAGVYKNYYGYN